MLDYFKLFYTKRGKTKMDWMMCYKTWLQLMQVTQNEKIFFFRWKLTRLMRTINCFPKNKSNSQIKTSNAFPFLFLKSTKVNAANSKGIQDQKCKKTSTKFLLQSWRIHFQLNKQFNDAKSFQRKNIIMNLLLFNMNMQSSNLVQEKEKQMN